MSQSIYQLHAMDYIEAGYSAIPLQGKRPYEGINWRKHIESIPNDAEIERYSILEHAGIGIVCGAVSNIVALDIDVDPESTSMEQRMIAMHLKEVIPPSPVKKFGSKGYTSFYQYTPQHEKSRNWACDGGGENGKRGNVVELLSNGRQTAIPPTIHPDTKRSYMWWTPDTLLSITQSELPVLPVDITDQITHALSRFGGSSGFEPPKRVGADDVGIPVNDQTWNDVVSALECLPRDFHYDEWIKIGMALKTTNRPEAESLWVRWSMGTTKDLKGNGVPFVLERWRSFQGDAFNYTSIFSVAEMYGWRNPAKGSRPTLKLVTSEPVTQDDLPPEEEEEFDVWSFSDQEMDVKRLERHVANPSDDMMRLMQWFSRLGPWSNAAIAETGALALVAAAAMRRYRTPMGHTSSMQYLLLGGTGVGKDVVRVGLDIAFRESGIEGILGGSRFTSQGAMVNQLIRNGGQMLSVQDEFADTLGNALGRNSGATWQVVTAMKTIYSTASKGTWGEQVFAVRNADEAKADKNMAIHCPNLTLVGIGTPDKFASVISGAEMSDGFLNRMVVNTAKLRECHFNREIDVNVPEWITERLQRICNTTAEGIDISSYDVPPKWRTVSFGPGVGDLLTEKTLEIRELMARLEGSEYTATDRLEGEMLARVPENAARMATGIAVWQNPEHPIITMDQIEWCVNYVQTRAYDALEVCRNQGVSAKADGMFSQYLDMVLHQIRKEGKDGILHKHLIRRAPMRSMEAKKRQEILTALIDNGEITMRSKGRAVEYVAKSTRRKKKKKE